VVRRTVMRLFLSGDLVKASIVKYRDSPEKQDLQMSPHMRVKETTLTKPGGEQRMVGRMERKYAGQVHNKPAYRCKDCGTRVRPPRTEFIESPGPKGSKEAWDAHHETVAHHEKMGADVHPRPDGHLVVHPAMEMREGKKRILGHGVVTAEMIPTRTQAGKYVSGSCPSCHTGSKPKPVTKSHALFDTILESFGKPMAQRKGESSNEYMSRIIRHLMKDKGYDQKRAVAAAYEMSGHPKKRVEKSLRLYLGV
jgi:hypothetical protein